MKKWGVIIIWTHTDHTVLLPHRKTETTLPPSIGRFEVRVGKTGNAKGKSSRNDEVGPSLGRVRRRRGGELYVCAAGRHHLVYAAAVDDTHTWPGC